MVSWKTCSNIRMKSYFKHMQLGRLLCACLFERQRTLEGWCTHKTHRKHVTLISYIQINILWQQSLNYKLIECQCHWPGWPLPWSIVRAWTFLRRKSNALLHSWVPKWWTRIPDIDWNPCFFRKNSFVKGISIHKHNEWDRLSRNTKWEWEMREDGTESTNGKWKRKSDSEDIERRSQRIGYKFNRSTQFWNIPKKKNTKKRQEKTHLSLTNWSVHKATCWRSKSMAHNLY